ncbi:MAG: PEGA domain-containing protein [Deltaproteobacteria bacterium]|nr:MAG: PEGA domain-containing protein [Deltaproteobacteria bacterium]
MPLRLHIAIAIAVALWAGRAAAAPPVRVALAPPSTLGAEASAKQARALGAALERALASVPGHAVVGPAAVRRAVARARKPELRTCDGDVACLADLGALLGVDRVVYVEVGGLGDARVLAMQLVDVASRTEVRSITAELTAADVDRSARAAAYRLLAPQRYVGTLQLDVDVPGAAIYVDGTQIGVSPMPPREIAVGSHALRVTHPEYRDFVRFVDIEFDTTTKISVALKAFPIVEDAMRQTGGPSRGAPEAPAAAPTPWYKRWYTLVGASAVVLVGSAIVVGLVTRGVDADRVEIVGD